MSNKLCAIDEVANLEPELGLEDFVEPEYWADKVTGDTIEPSFTLACLHANDPFAARHVRRALDEAEAHGVAAREVLTLWAASEWKQVACVVRPSIQ